MKIRTDFVTNSSSSSFIISFRENNETYNNIFSALFKMEDRRSDTIVKNKEELLSALSCKSEEEVYTEGQYTIDIYEKSLEKLANGYVVAFATVDWDNEGVSKLFYELQHIDNEFSILECD